MCLVCCCCLFYLSYLCLDCHKNVCLVHNNVLSCISFGVRNSCFFCKRGEDVFGSL